MKKTILSVVVLIMAATWTYAQETYPIHTISKDVQKIQFRGKAHTPSSMVTGDLTALSSKGVARLQPKLTSNTGVVIKTTGIPPHVISKGVARMQYERMAR
jgi:hypothetical protein